MKKCPFCAEKIQDAAVKCRYCGSSLNERAKPSGSAATSRERKPLIRTGFKVALLAFLGIPILLMMVCDRFAASKQKPRTQLQTSNAVDEGEKVEIPSDPKSTYYIIQRAGDTRNPIVTTKRVGPSGISYTRRLFDCQQRTAKYLGEGDTLDELSRAKPSDKMGPLVEGSITETIWRQACKK